MSVTQKSLLIVGNSAWAMFNFRKSFLQFLVRQGIAVSILVPHDEFSEKLRALGCTVMDWPLESRGLNPFKELFSLSSLRRVIKSGQYQFVLAYTIKACFYSLLARPKTAKVRIISFMTGLGRVFTSKSAVFTIVRTLFIALLKWSDAVLVLNNADKTDLLGFGLSPSKVVLIPGEGIDTTWFTASAPSVSLEEGTLSLCYIGRLKEEKGLRLLMDALSKVRSQGFYVTVTLVGDLEPGDPIVHEDLQKWLGTGYVNHVGFQSDIRPYLSQSDCLVLPSRYSEGLPRVLLEAGAMAKPVITTDNRGCSDVVVHGLTGFIGKTGNLEDLISCIKAMVNLSRHERIKMGNAANQRVMELFSDPIVHRRLWDALGIEK